MGRGGSGGGVPAAPGLVQFQDVDTEWEACTCEPISRETLEVSKMSNS